MEIVNPVREKDITEYDFALTNGVRLTQSIDVTAGDYMEDNEDHYAIFLSRKPSLSNPEDMLDEELVKVFKDKVAVLITRKRKQRLPTDEELFDMRKTLLKLAKTVQ
jgi:hypothetical protein